ncbi:hypothetical protein AHAS_Ahas03G0121900 [Arachis hypogaea]
MLEIVMGPKNSLIEKALMKALDDHPIHRNQSRNKRKEVRTPSQHQAQRPCCSR